MPTTFDESQRHVVVAENELLEIPLPTYRCEYCGFSVKTKANLRAHQVKTHKILQNDADWAFFSKRKRQFTYVYHCPVVPCKHNIGFDLGFSSISRLKQHYQTVHMKRSYKCDRCGALFATPSSQAYHMRFCGTVFVCSVCSRRYSSKKHLDQHFRRSGHRLVGKITPQNNYGDNHCSPLPGSKKTSINHNIVPTDSVPASFTSPPQTVVVPLVLLPVNVCGSSGTDRDMSVCGANCSGNMALMPVLVSGGFPASLLQGLLHGSNVASTGFQSVNRAPVSLAQKFDEPNLISASSRSVVDGSTQTEGGTPLTSDPLAVSSVSVKTCTDEDDIRSFIGSLFCDAGVETNFPFTELDTKACEDQDCRNSAEKSNDDGNATTPTQFPDFLPPPVINTVAATPEPKPSTAKAAYATKPNSPEFFPFDLVDEGIQTRLRHSIEHASMQTDVVAKMNVGAATHDIPFQFLGDRLLETPPPLSSTVSAIFPYPKQPETQHSPLVSGSKNDSMSPPDSGLFAINTFLRGPIPHSSSSSAPDNNSDHQLHVLTGRPSSFESSADLSGGSSSHSVGLQACHWSPDRAYSSIASQTLSDDWDSWFHSVHTQTTSLVCPSMQSFSDMCVGVDDMFLDANLNPLELTNLDPQGPDVSFDGTGAGWSLTQTDKQTD